MVIRNGMVTSRFQLKVQVVVIPGLGLGKPNDDSLSDRINVSLLEKRVYDWLRKIEGSGLAG